MNNLRLILFLLGIAVVAGIFMWDYIQRRQDKRLRTIDISRRKITAPSISIKPRGEDEGDLPEVRAPLVKDKETDISNFSIPTGRNAVLGENKTTIADLFSNDSVSEVKHGATENKHRNKIGSEQIIILHVTGREGQQFSGENIVNALEQLEFQFGKMNIFHHYGVGEIKSEYPLFSAVNMLEPGYFDPDAISQLSTPGISLFLCLPAPVEAEVVFEFMLDISCQLADLLHGDVRNEDHRLLDKNIIVDIKKRIAKAE